MVAPCYIIICYAFALTGRTRKPGCSTKPRVPLRSALGYAQIALSGRTRNSRCANCPFRAHKKLKVSRLPFQGARETMGCQPRVTQ